MTIIEFIRYIGKQVFESMEYLFWELFLPRGNEGGDLTFPKKILVVQLGSIGDILMATPALEAMRKRFPDSRIDILLLSGLGELLAENSNIDDVISFPKRYWRRFLYSPREFKRGAAVIEEIQKTKYDVAVDLVGTYDSVITTMLCRAKESIGPKADIKSGIFRGATDEYYGTSIDPGDGHIIDRYLGITSVFQCPDVDRTERISVGGPFKDAGDALIREKGLVPGEFFVLHPGAKWPPKRWPAGYFADLAEKINLKYGLAPVIVGGDSDAELLAVIEEVVFIAEANILKGVDLAVMAHIIGKSKLFVGNDSGLAHMAAAVGTPSVVLFGPTLPSKCAPAGSSVEVVEDRISCRPCKLYFRRDRCERGRNDCLKNITPETVMDKVDQLIGTI